MSLRRRTAGLFAAVSVAASLLVAGGSPAQAATTCRSAVGLPASVVIDRRYQALQARFYTTCPSVDGATDSLFGTDGLQDYFDWDAPTYGSTTPWDVYDDDLAPGHYTTRDGQAFLPSGTSSFTETSTDVRLGSAVGIQSVANTGSAVTLSFSSLQYDPNPGTKVLHGERVQLQFDYDGTWKPLATVYTNAQGRGRYTYSLHGVRTYRVVVLQNPTVAASSSATARR